MLELSNVINISVSQAPVGLGEYNVNNVALFTDETPDPDFPAAGFLAFVSAAAVGEAFGTDSLTYKMAVAFFSQNPNVLNGGGELIIAPMAGASLAKTDISGLAAKVFFVGVLATAYPTSTGWKTLADDVQAMGDKILILPSATYADVAGAFSDIQEALDTRTRCLYYSVSTDDAHLLFAAAYAGAGFSVNYDASNATLTMNLKQLTTILTDSDIDQTKRDACKAAGVDVYANVAGVPAVLSSGANDFFDNVLNLVWFVSELKVAGFNALAQVASKIAQTEPGVSVLKSAYRGVCLEAVNNGYIAPGQWNSPETFGVQADFFSNIAGFGFYIYSVPVNKQSAADRTARKAPLIRIAVKLAGAIHSSDVIVSLNA